MSVLSQRVSTPKRERTVKNPLPWYTPRFWHGMRASTWFSTLARNGFPVSLSRLHTCASISLCTFVNSAAATVDGLLYSRRVAETELVAPPIFILGHWRAGTTFLHELLIRDPEFTYPNTYQCFVPHHFLFTGTWLAPLVEPLLPKRRPMDNMAAGWNHPQEDEFAMACLGVPTPYLSMMFPRRGATYPEYLDLQSLSPRELDRWKSQLFRFFQRITFRDPRRIVVKSPPHTARVRTLLELFPEAKFVHITRNPYELFVSTVNLWKSLNEEQRMQGLGDQEWVEEYVLDSLERMYQAYEADCQQLAEDQIYQIRFEDLVKDPCGALDSVYSQLDLGSFSRAEETVSNYLSSVKNYRRNHYDLPDEKGAIVRKRWSSYFESYGYEK